MSANPCGCDPEANWVCEAHQRKEGQPIVAGPLRASNPRFGAVIRQMVETHNRKSSDYAKDVNRYSNFEESAACAGCSVDTVFLVMIGVKLARLRELLSSGKSAQNESVQDSRMDLAVYAALWASYHTEGV